MRYQFYFQSGEFSSAFRCYVIQFITKNCHHSKNVLKNVAQQNLKVISHFIIYSLFAKSKMRKCFAITAHLLQEKSTVQSSPAMCNLLLGRWRKDEGHFTRCASVKSHTHTHVAAPWMGRISGLDALPEDRKFSDFNKHWRTQWRRAKRAPLTHTHAKERIGNPARQWGANVSRRFARFYSSLGKSSEKHSVSVYKAHLDLLRLFSLYILCIQKKGSNLF